MESAADASVTQHLAVALYGDDFPIKRLDLLDAIFEGAGAEARFVLDHLTSGCDLSRKIVAQKLEAIINRVAVETSNGRERGDPYLAVYRVTREILIAWHLGAILKETGLPDSPELLGRVLKYGVLKGDERFRTPSQENHQYWRGLAIMAVARVDSSREIALHSTDFALWAGAHPSPGRIIELVVARGTLNIPTLSALLGQQETGHSAIAAGVL